MSARQPVVELRVRCCRRRRRRRWSSSRRHACWGGLTLCIDPFYVEIGQCRLVAQLLERLGRLLVDKTTATAPPRVLCRVERHGGVGRRRGRLAGPGVASETEAGGAVEEYGRQFGGIDAMARGREGACGGERAGGQRGGRVRFCIYQGVASSRRKSSSSLQVRRARRSKAARRQGGTFRVSLGMDATPCRRVRASGGDGGVGVGVAAVMAPAAGGGMDDGRWTMDDGRWLPGCGWAADSGQRAAGSGQRAVCRGSA